jgi:hypothetical protein
MNAATDSTCSMGSDSSALYRAHPFAVPESCFGWGSVRCTVLTADEVARRQDELQKRYPDYHVHVWPAGESVLYRNCWRWR